MLKIFFMNPDPKQQICELIKKSESPLILISEKTEGAAIAGALALFLALKKINKNPEIVCSEDIPEKFSYLPGIKSIKRNISAERFYKIFINVGEDNIKELAYEKVDKILTIYLSTKAGSISRESISVASSEFVHDLIIAVAVLSMEPLGRLYLENKEFFSKTPIIGIGSPFPNQFKGANLTEIVSRFVSERVAGLTRELIGSDWDREIATLLLFGVIDETNNFQSPKIDHKIFSLAASLMSAGADREEIIRHL